VRFSLSDGDGVRRWTVEIGRVIIVNNRM
jgi:hypothetical protein